MLSRLGWECGLRCFLPTRRWLLSYWPPFWSLAPIMALVRCCKEDGRIVPPWQTKPSQLGHFSRRGLLEHLKVAPLYHALGKALHLFKLWTALKEEEINAHCFKLGNAVRNLARRTHQSRTQSPVTDGVIFKRNMLVEFRTGQPLLIIVVAGGGLLHIGNACQFVLRLPLRVTNNRIGGDNEGHRPKSLPFSSLGHVSDLGTDTIRRIPMHHEGVAAFADQLPGRFGFAARVNRGSWL